MHRVTSPTVRARRRSASRRGSSAGTASGSSRRASAVGHSLSPWATALSAVAAAIGLFFSATVALSSVDATRQQAGAGSSSAGRTGGFLDRADPEGDETVIIANRSLDPVARVDLWFYAPDAGIDPSVYEWVSWASRPFPPCTWLIFAPRAFDDYLLEYGLAQGGAPIRAVQFFDADGRWWLRDPDGLRKAEYERVTGEDVGIAPGRQEPAEHCDT
ncbi:hypothetical protein ACWEQL_08445 [Kitasatospora sp. NPDC004240]